MLGFRELRDEELAFVSGGDIVVTGTRSSSPISLSYGSGGFFGGGTYWDSGQSNDQSAVDDWNPDGDDDGDGILNKDEDIVVTSTKPDPTPIGDGLLGRLYPDGVAEVYQIDYEAMGIPFGHYIGNYHYSINPSDGGFSFSFPWGISYEPADTSYSLTPIDPSDPDGTSSDRR